MMNSLITQSLLEGNIVLLLGFPDVLMSKMEKRLVSWILEYSIKYAKPPTLNRLESEFDIFVPVISTDPLGDIYDRTLVKKRNEYTRTFIIGIQEELKKGADPLPYIEQLHQQINAGNAGITRYTKFDRSLYLRRETSFPYEIEQVDKYTGGIGQGDLIYLIGRLGTGKTSMAIYIIAKWLQRNRRILMVSNENRADDIVNKIDAYMGGFNPLKKRTMDWSEDDKHRISTVSYIASKMDGEVYIPNKPIRGVSELNSLVYTYRPDIVVVDGIYLMGDVAGDSHWEKITDVSRRLKRLAEDEGVPVLGIHQANRNAIGKRIEVEHIAYADALAQDADLLLAINKEESGDIFCECIKNRWGSDSWGFFLKFYWESMYVKVYDTKTEEIVE